MVQILTQIHTIQLAEKCLEHIENYDTQIYSGINSPIRFRLRKYQHFSSVLSKIQSHY